MRTLLTLLILMLMTNVGSAQAELKTLTVFTETAPSNAQEIYLEVLNAELQEHGFSVSMDGAPIQVERGEIHSILAEVEGALGLAFLQSQLNEGDTAAALLSAPGAFYNLSDQRVAQSGIIGDTARDEITTGEVIALRLWPHSIDALISTTNLASIADFSGTRVVTVDPYSSEFIAQLGASPMQLAFPEVFAGVQRGVAEAAVVPQDALSDDTLHLFSEGTMFLEHKFRTGVTLTSASWWRSLTAAEQRNILIALESAEQAAGEYLDSETEFALARATEQSLNVVSWQTFSPSDVQRAVNAAISEITRADASPILELRDRIDLLQQGTSPNLDPPIQHDFDQDGSLIRSARIFFASDRRYDDQEGAITDRFANTEDPSATVRCGELKPAEPGPIGTVAERIELAPATRISRGIDCAAKISTAGQETGGKILVFVHGFRSTFDDAVRSGLAFARDIEFQGTVLVWSWPSAGALRSYSFDEESVVWSEPHFASLVSELVDVNAEIDVNFIAHSMGSRLLSNLMRDHWINVSSAIVLAAADVARPLIEQSVNAAPSASLTILATEGDRALIMSRNMHQRPRAGHSRPLFLLPGVDTIDLSAFDRFFSTNHGHAFLVPEVVSDLRALFGGRWRAVDRGLAGIRDNASGLDYYAIAPDGG